MQEAPLLNTQDLRRYLAHLDFRLENVARDGRISRSACYGLRYISWLIDLVFVDVVLFKGTAALFASFAHYTHIHFGYNSGSGRSLSYLDFLLNLLLFYWWLPSEIWRLTRSLMLNSLSNEFLVWTLFILAYFLSWIRLLRNKASLGFQVVIRLECEFIVDSFSLLFSLRLIERSSRGTHLLL